MLFRPVQTPIEFINAFRKDQGVYLRIWRAKTGLSMSKAAERFNVVRHTWLNWESNRSEMKVASLTLFMKAWEEAWPAITEN